MSSAVLERTARTPAVQEYSLASHDSTLADSVLRDWFCDARSAKAVVSVLAGALAASASAAVPVQPDAHATFGQVWAINSCTLVAFEHPTAPQPSVELSAEEHQVLRQAIWDSAEFVAKGRLVEL